MIFEGELSLERIDDVLDPLALPGGVAGARGLILAVRPDQMRLEIVADERFEAAAGETLIAKDDLPSADQVVLAFQQGRR